MYIGVFNDSFELFFFQFGMTARHTSLMTLKNQELGANAQIYLGFSLIHAWSKIHIQAQIYLTKYIHHSLTDLDPSIFCFYKSGSRGAGAYTAIHSTCCQSVAGPTCRQTTIHTNSHTYGQCICTPTLIFE